MIHRHRWDYLAHPDPACGGRPVWRVCHKCQIIEKLGFEGWYHYMNAPRKATA